MERSGFNLFRTFPAAAGKLILWFLLLLSTTAYGQKLEDLLKDLPAQKEDTLKVRLLNKIIYASFFNDPSKAIKYVDTMMLLSRKLNYQKGIGDAYQYRAEYHSTRSDWPQMKWNLAKADSIQTIIGDLRGQISSRGLSARYYKETGNYEAAMKEYQTILGNYQKIGEKRGMAVTLSSMGQLFATMKRYTEAETYFLKSLALRTEIKDERGVSQMNLNLGAINNDMHRYDKALNYFQRCLETQKTLKDDGILATCRINMGNSYSGKKQYGKAIAIFDQSYANYSRMGDTVMMAYSLFCKSAAYGNKGEYQTALAVLQKGYDFIKDEPDLTAMKGDFQENFYEVYKKLGMDKEALEAFEQANEFRSDIFSTEVAGTISDLKEKYETAQKEQENKTLKATSAIQQLAIDRKQNLIYAMVIFVVVLLAAVFLIFRQKNTIARQQQHLLKQRLLVSQMNPHFIFNSLTAIQNYIYKQDRLNAGLYLSRFSGLMRMILEFSREDKISLQSETDLLKNYLDLQQIRFESRFVYELTVSEDLDMYRTFIPPMLSQPFIENALEHGLAHKTEKGHLFVRFLKRGEHLVIEIEDDGVGLEKARELRETLLPGHRSLATTITHERIGGLNKKHGSQIRLDVADTRNEAGEVSGVLVTFTLPLILLNHKP